eukprot:Rhum_TRINITY_DN11643_c0_g1::Rhum_TRINITY_DN11643_c0_g1_i1::g.45960::m.45960
MGRRGAADVAAKVLPFRPSEGLATPSPYCMLLVLWCSMLPPLVGVAAWVWQQQGDSATPHTSRGEPLSIDTSLRVMLLPSLSLPLIFVLSYVCYVGRKFFVHN